VPDHGDTDLAIPEGGLLVHIGFPKTGTTSVQFALASARAQLPAHGVVYPGKARYHKEAGIYLAQATPRRGDRPADEADWTKLAAECNRARQDRVIISSEWLSETPTAGIERLVHDLGADRVHVVATLRPLVKIMPSAWQQYLQNGNRIPFERWLRGMLLRPPYNMPTPSFWARHRHGDILRRWAEVVGPDRVTAIVVDSSDHSLLLTQFELMLGLPKGVLADEPPERDNRSLSWPEAEMVRLVNKTFRESGWTDDLWRSTMRLGVIHRLAELQPQRNAMPKLELPGWAVERAVEIGAGFAREIDQLGIRVVGDLDSLGEPPDHVRQGRPPRPLVPASIASEAILAALQSALEVGRREGRAAAAAELSQPSVTSRFEARLRHAQRLLRRQVKRHGPDDGPIT
jgi:hypothetical protein